MHFDTFHEVSPSGIPYPPYLIDDVVRVLKKGGSVVVGAEVCGDKDHVGVASPFVVSFNKIKYTEDCK